MNPCQCHDDHPFTMFGTLLGDNCVGLTGWGFVFMFATVLIGVLVMVPAAHYLSR